MTEFGVRAANRKGGEDAPRLASDRYYGNPYHQGLCLDIRCGIVTEGCSMMPVWRCCRDQRDGRDSPFPDRGSGDADGVRASEVQHAVEDVDGDLHLGRPTFVGVRAQSVADHPFEARHGRLGPGTLGVAGRYLPRHATILGDVAEVTVALRGRGPGRVARHRSGTRRHDDGGVRVARADAGGDAFPMGKASPPASAPAIRTPPSSRRRAQLRCRATRPRPRPRSAPAISRSSPSTAAWLDRRRPATPSVPEPRPRSRASSG